jgi:hypothetical protein
MLVYAAKTLLHKQGHPFSGTGSSLPQHIRDSQRRETLDVVVLPPNVILSAEGHQLWCCQCRGAKHKRAFFFQGRFRLYALRHFHVQTIQSNQAFDFGAPFCHGK